MTITYPLSFPGSIKPRSINVGGINTVSTNRSPFTLKSQIQVWEGQTWTLDVTLPPLTVDQVRDWQAFVVALKGPRGTFYFGDLLQAAPRGSWVGTPLVHIGAQVGEKINLHGFSSSVAGVISPGDYFSIDDRLYMAVNPAGHASDASGYITVDIWPRLRQDHVNNTPVVTSNPRGIWRLANTEFQWGVNEALAYDLSFSAVEAI